MDDGGLTQAPSDQQVRRAHPVRPWIHLWSAWALLAVEVLVGVAALWGIVILVGDIPGQTPPQSMLDASPFSTWTVPGYLLLLSVAVPQLMAAAAVAVPWPWGDRSGYRAGLLAGVGLMLWIIVQLLVPRQFSPLQPTIAAFGLGRVAAGLVLAPHLPSSRLRSRPARHTPGKGFCTTSPSPGGSSTAPFEVS